MNTLEEAAHFLLWLLIGIFFMHVVIQKDGMAWLKSKFVVERK